MGKLYRAQMGPYGMRSGFGETDPAKTNAADLRATSGGGQPRGIAIENAQLVKIASITDLLLCPIGETGVASPQRIYKEND